MPHPQWQVSYFSSYLASNSRRRFSACYVKLVAEPSVRDGSSQIKIKHCLIAPHSGGGIAIDQAGIHQAVVKIGRTRELAHGKLEYLDSLGDLNGFNQPYLDLQGKFNQIN